MILLGFDLVNIIKRFLVNDGLKPLVSGMFLLQLIKFIKFSAYLFMSEDTIITPLSARYSWLTLTALLYKIRIGLNQ